MMEDKEEMQDVKDTQEEEKRILSHKESGLQYYNIKLNATAQAGKDKDKSVYLRLFESDSPARLKWKEDEESHDEYKIRRMYLNKIDKQKRGGTLVWNSREWGTCTPQNALRIQQMLNKENGNTN